MATRRTAQQIIEAVADGAAELFAERSPSAVSVREIAAAADVNLGLIHRYVGSKDDVIALVLTRHTERARAAIASAADTGQALDMVAETVVNNPATGRLVAGLILDGVDVAAVKGEFPMLELLANDHDPVDAAITYALALGWEVFGPSLLNAVDASPGDPQLTNKLAAALKTVSAAPVDSSSA
ncbi:MAG: TetR/AcrR family transcriptional regulator [Ilumatobacter sp.]|uniref:TetR/AcrR family transcriptional regulator n=1 Tax=Ilumatobacter sp. TaxID=1967498 RepID=UPI00391C5CD7